MSSENLHAPRDRLSRKTVTVHQAIVSLMEELDAVDWYQQRADDCDDPALREILLHNMREEVEHAVMVLEWLRRNHDEFRAQMEVYLFSQGDVLALEEHEDGGGGGGTEAQPAPPPKRTIGSLKGGRQPWTR